MGATGSGVVRDVRLTPVAVPDPPLLNAWGVHAPWALRIVVEVVTDDAVGIGEAQGGEAALRRLDRAARAVVGADVRDPDELEARVRRALPDVPERALLTAFSPLEVAALDAHGRMEGARVVELLGGPVRTRVDLAGYLFFKWPAHPAADGRPVEPDAWGAVLDPGGVVASAEQLVGRYGFRSLKLKGGVFPPEVEVACVRALHAAFPGVPLRLDPNGAWTVDTAATVAQELTGLLEYLEDPTPCGPGMAELGGRVHLPLATNMCIAEADEIGPAARDGWVSVLLLDHHYWGGLRRSVAVAERCARLGWGVSLHSNTHLGVSLAAMAHLGAATGHLTHAGDTHYPWTADHDVVLPGDVAIEAGAVAVPDGPGIGVRLDHDALGAAHEAYLRCGLRERADTAYMRTVHPDFDPALPRW